MRLSSDWILIILASAGAFLLMKIEWYIKLWYWKKHKKLPIPVAVLQEVGFIKGAARNEPCSKCGAWTNEFYVMNDGSVKCRSCKISTKIKMLAPTPRQEVGFMVNAEKEIKCLNCGKWANTYYIFTNNETRCTAEECYLNGLGIK